MVEEFLVIDSAFHHHGEKRGLAPHGALGRPMSRNNDTFAYDSCGQVTNMVRGGRYPKTDTYVYDFAGNRTESDDQAMGYMAYQSNALNQYTDAGLEDFSYDADGNLAGLGDGSLFFWDSDNRFVCASNETAISRFDYDWRHRRVRSEDIWQGSPQNRHFLVYDGWNIVHEEVDLWYWDTGWERTRDVDFFWGPDLSGTLQGAGGVGGLVAVSIAGQYYFPCYDNLGNIVAYVDESGVTVASYTYDAFGYTLSSSGSLQYTFPHRFSTKYQDEFSGFYDYGYRWYWAEYGRWLNRDPIGEEGGVSLYGFCNNDPLIAYDFLGHVPKASDFWTLYDKYSYTTLQTSEEVWNVVGGSLKEFFKENGGLTVNTCATRLSLCLAQLPGNEIPKANRQFVNITSDTKPGVPGNYITSAEKMGEYLRKSWGTKEAKSCFEALYFKSKAKTLELEKLREEIVCRINQNQTVEYVAVVFSKNKSGGYTGHIAVVTPNYADDHTPCTDENEVWILPPTE